MLEDDYGNAWSEWDATGEAEIWSDTVGDGIGDLRGEIERVDPSPQEGTGHRLPMRRKTAEIR